MRCDPVIDPPRERCGNGTRIYSTYCYSGVGASAVPLDLCATFRFGFIGALGFPARPWTEVVL